MSRKYRKKKQFERANYTAYPSGTPGGGMMYVPPGYAQSTYGQQFYGSNTQNIATGTNALFSPGLPLPTQPNVNPGGFPVQWRFPVAVNTFPVDRSLGDPDTPSFQQLRNLANLYSGISICERVWFDMVPRMKLEISLKPEFIAAGANEKDYRTDITYFKHWFEKPDKEHDLHSWIRMALKDQTQIDELYVYKRKTRGGGLYALELVAGDQMKPLLDDWGKAPKPPSFAYQQYPWGLPGAWFKSDELFHYQESPSSNTPYGHSRVERIILLVNQALRKQKKDLSHFTEGNIPQGMMLVPDTAIWTPDQIDAFEQAWNALLSGNQQQQVRMRFTQPGMKYQPFEQYVLDPAFDQFLLNETVAAYGLSMQDLGFTGDIHKSSGDSQQNVTYRRTIDPLALVYAEFFTRIINTEFDPDFHGDMFLATFTGYDEKEDVSAMANAYTLLTNSGILGITSASKLLNLPDDPDAPYIGRVITTKEGPIFLDDIANEKVRQAQMQAKLANYEQQVDQIEQQKEQAAEAKSEKMMQMIQQPQSSSNNQTSSTEALQTQTQMIKQQQKMQEQFEQQQQEETLEEEILKALAEDEEPPYTNLERQFAVRHYAGMHDQKSHGNWSQGPSEKDPDQETSKDKDDPNAAISNISKAEQQLLNAQNQEATATTAQAKANAKAAVAQARLELKAAKLEQKAELAEEKVEQKQELAEQKAALAEQKLQAHIEKLAQAAANKALKAQQTAEKKAAIAAAKAARSLAKSEKAAEREQLKIQKAEEKAAKVLNNLILTIGNKAKTYALLSSRKLSNTWTIKDARAATAITQNLQQLLNSVIYHEGSATSLLNNLYAEIGILQSSTGLYASQTKMLQTLESKIDQELLRSVTIEEDLFEKIETLFQQHIGKNQVLETSNDVSADYRRWRNRALEDVKNNRAIRGFTTILIPERIHTFISTELEKCTNQTQVKDVFERARGLEIQHKPTLFVDVDGVLNIEDQSVEPFILRGKAVLAIPHFTQLLQKIETYFTPVWLTHWGEKANGWNDAAHIAHWPVWFPLSEKEETLAKQTYPHLHEKSLAIALYMQYHPEISSGAWLQDGFSLETRKWAKEQHIHLIDTLSEPLHSWLISKDMSTINSILELLQKEEIYS